MVKGILLLYLDSGITINPKHMRCNKLPISLSSETTHPKVASSKTINQRNNNFHHIHTTKPIHKVLIYKPMKVMERAFRRNVSYSLTLFRVNKSDVIPPINQLIHLARNTIQKGMSTEGGGKITTPYNGDRRSRHTHKKRSIDQFHK